MINKFLEKKYGKHITDTLVYPPNKLINKYDVSVEGQKAVISHLKDLSNEKGEKLIPTKFFSDDVEWGLDFSGWIGEIHQENKEYFFIGTEPHLESNFQIVYDFGNIDNNINTLNQTALHHYNKINDIWHNVTNVFIEDLTESNISNFLNKCYITDLCHIVPKQCGQVDSICNKIKIKRTEWNNFRSAIAHEFLFKEISLIQPKIIILHGNASRKFFHKYLDTKNPYSITASKFKIFEGKINIDGVDFSIISIPHLKGEMMRKLWGCKQFPERQKSAKAIIQKLINKTTNRVE